MRNMPDARFSILWVLWPAVGIGSKQVRPVLRCRTLAAYVALPAISSESVHSVDL